MAPKLSKAESKRLYSWWWDSHIPKNSKWIQENLSDMDVKVKSMLKLIEEDADSFAKRADMYYKKRPELIKLVEDFYRAYRSLAESYDKANGTLREAQISMFEAFPDQIPSELRKKLSLCLETDQQFTDDEYSSVGSHSNVSTPVQTDNEEDENKTGGIRKLMDFYSTGGSSAVKLSSSELSENKVSRKTTTDRVSSTAGRLYEEKPITSSISTGSTSQTWGGDILKLTSENRNLRKQIQSESNHRSKFESEIQSLQASHAKLEEQRDDALHQLRNSLTKITMLESEIEIFKTQNSQISKEISRLESGENRRRQIEAAKLKEMEEEVVSAKEALKDEHMRCVHAQAALESLENLNSRSVEAMRASMIEIKEGVQKLKEVEKKNQDLEQQLEEALSKIQTLNEENSLSSEAIRSMDGSICMMKEEMKRVEDEFEMDLTTKNSLNVQLLCLSEEISDLQRIKNTVGRVEEENALHVKKLEDERDEISEKKVAIEVSLMKSNTELENLRSKIIEVEESHEILLQQNAQIESEKEKLVSLVDTFTNNMEELNERNGILEISLSDSIAEVEDLQENLKSLEDTCQSLEDDKSKLQNENKSLISQVEKMGDNLDDLGYKFAELQVMHFDLLKEKESKDEQLTNVQNLLQFQKQHYESMLNSSNHQLTRLEDEISRLHEQGDYREDQTDERQVKIIAAEIQVFIIQRYMKDLKANESKLSKKWKIMEQYIQRQQGEDQLLSNNIKQLKQMIGIIWKALNTTSSNNGNSINYRDFCEIKDGAEGLYFEHIMDKIKSMQDSIREFKDEKQSFSMEKSVYVTLLQQLGYQIADLRLEKNDLYEDCQKKNDEIVGLQVERNKLHEVMSKQENEGLTRRFSNLRNDIHLLEEEYNVIFQRASVLSTGVQSKMVNEEINSQIHQLDNLIENRIVQNKTAKLLESEGIRSELDEIKNTIDKLEKKLEIFMEQMVDRENNKTVSDISTDDHIEDLKNIDTESNEKEIRVSEEDFTVLWCDLHIANVHAVLFEERVVELMKLCESLETKYTDQMKKFKVADEQNNKTKDELNEYMSILPSLGESIKSLETLILPLLKSEQKKTQENEGASGGILGLHTLLLKVDALRDVLIEFRVENKKDYSCSSNTIDGPIHVVDKISSPSKMKKKEKDPNQEWNKKVIRTLSHDTNRLSKLEENVEELKNKMQTSKVTNELLESFEFDVVKKQLGNAQETILQLVDTNRKLIEKVHEDCSTSAAGTINVVQAEISEEEEDTSLNQKMKKKRMYSIKRGSAKIDRLELELNKLQDVLGKLENDYENRQDKMGEKKYRVLLRDYFYGKSEERKRRKKNGGHFCGCIG